MIETSISALSNEEVSAAALLSLRNKKLSEEDFNSAKNNFCGRFVLNKEEIICFVCSDLIPNYPRSIFNQHIRDHLKKLKVYL